MQSEPLSRESINGHEYIAKVDVLGALAFSSFVQDYDEETVQNVAEELGIDWEEVTAYYEKNYKGVVNGK